MYTQNDTKLMNIDKSHDHMTTHTYHSNTLMYALYMTLVINIYNLSIIVFITVKITLITAVIIFIIFIFFFIIVFFIIVIFISVDIIIIIR